MEQSTRTIVISDLHIGTNAPTCWYQKDFHEPYLIRLLAWILDHKDEIREVVILGDLLDFWTYPLTHQPPTMDAIVKANPNILGSDGKLREVLDTLGGRVVYLHGNHDINVTQDDLNRIGGAAHKIQLVPDAYVKDDVLYTHGHLSTMFNGPSPGELPSLPLGYFVTKCISQMVERDYPGKTAADLPDHGAPYGLDWKKLVESRDPSIAAAFLEYIAKVTKVDRDQPIKLLDGAEMSINRAKAVYANLWTEWVKAFGGELGGETAGEIAAYRAARADYNGSYLGWFVERLRRQRGTRAVVMGHTHLPRKGLRSKGDSPCSDDVTTISCFSEYYNNGFLCPSRPDVEAGKRFTFTSLSQEHDGSQIMEVVKKGGSYDVEPLLRPHSAWIVESPSMDYSCYMEVENPTDRDLVRKQPPLASHGYYVAEPPELIPARTRALFWIQDFPGLKGTKGSVEYAPKSGGRSFTLQYGCPTGLQSNFCNGAPFKSRSGEGRWGKPNQVAKRGHPFFVTFTIQPT